MSLLGGCYFADAAQCNERCVFSVTCSPKVTSELMSALGTEMTCTWKDDSTEGELQQDCNDACMQSLGELDGDDRADVDAYWQCYKDAVGDLNACDLEQMAKASGDTCVDEAGKAGNKKFTEALSKEFVVDSDAMTCK
jgi:hypothetical protein